MFPYVHELCRDYRDDGPADFAVSASRADIEFERQRAEYPASDGCLESLAAYRQIAEKMPAYDTLLMHGSCVAVEGGAHLFTAKSGTGKSTHTRLWRELLGNRAVMVNDDKPLIRIADAGAVACGTPWAGERRLNTNIAVPLKSICVLERSDVNRIEEITPSEALPTLLQQIYRPMDAHVMALTLNLIDRLARAVRLYRLGCNMDLSAAELSYNAMKG